MCKCNPSIRTPWCPNCISLIVDTVDVKMDRNKATESFEEVKGLIKQMNGLSEEGFNNRYMNDPLFNKGLRSLLVLISK